MATVYNKSIISGGDLEPLFSLGNFYVSDFLKENENPKGDPCELTLAFDPNTKLVQLTKQPDSSLMWGSMYYYYSHTNPIMCAALKDLAESVLQRGKVKRGVFLDIASNTFELTKNVPKDFMRVGCDPSDYSKFVDEDRIDIYIRDFFSKNAWKKQMGETKSDYITCAAMMYDLDNPIQFLKDISDILTDDGIFAVQVSYTPLNIELLELGAICHEHIAFYNFISLNNLIRETDLVIRDVELNTVNGGSIRLYIQKMGSNDYRNFIEKQVADTRINSLWSYEWEKGYGTNEPYMDFFYDLIQWKKDVNKFLSDLKLEGKIIAGAGASTKSATILQFLNIDNNTISFIGERQEGKHGLRTIGSNILIVSEKEMRTRNPDYLILFPWFFINDFLEREKEYLAKGGKIVVLSPDIRVYTKDGDYLI
jgi:SAM-dependent methyltransferase